MSKCSKVFLFTGYSEKHPFSDRKVLLNNPAQILKKANTTYFAAPAFRQDHVDDDPFIGMSVKVGSL